MVVGSIGTRREKRGAAVSVATVEQVAVSSHPLDLCREVGGAVSLRRWRSGAILLWAMSLRTTQEPR